MPTRTVAWTKQDAQQLVELIVRKEVFEAENGEPLRRLITTTWPFEVQSTPARQEAAKKKLYDWLINNADTIRDLLQPFDSSVRSAQTEQGK